MSDTQLARIETALVDVSEQVAEDRYLSKRRIAKHDRSIRVALGVGVGGAIVGMLGIVGVVLALVAIDNITETRAESRVATCQQDNATTDKVNNILRRLAEPSEARTPESQARVDALLAELLIPHRDCTPDGIEAFYTTSTTTP